MHTRYLMVAAAFGLALGTIAMLAAAPAEKADAQHIAKLIEQLGSGKFSEREHAMLELDKIGPPALEALKKATTSTDPEIRRRAEELVKRIAKRAESEQVLSPKQIHLKYKARLVEDAVADFAKKSGYTILLDGDKTKLAGRRITLDTGKTTFWQAFDQFCQKAGLVEANRTGPPMGGPALPPAALIRPGGKPPVAIPPVAMMMRPPFGFNDGRLILVDGKPKSLPTCYAGAVRIRALPPKTPVYGQVKQAGEILLALDVAPEPKIKWRSTVDVRIDRAVDDQDQKLSKATPGAPGPGVAAIVVGPTGGAPIARPALIMRGRPVFWAGQRQIPIRLKAGEKPAKVLKELKGAITAQVQTPPGTLMTVANILKAANKTVKGVEGSALKVLEVAREKNGNIKIRIQLDLPASIIPGGSGRAVGFAVPGVGAVAGTAVTVAAGPAPPPGKAPAGAAAPPAPAAGPVVPGGGAKPAFTINYSNFTGVSLLDDKGHILPLVAFSSSVRRVGNAITRELTFTYQPDKSRRDPAKLIFTGSRIVNVEVPFTLKNVPLS